jgi:hypothetical protein
MAKKTTRKTLHGTSRQKVGKPTYLIVNNPTGAAGNRLMGVKRPKGL